MGLVLDYSKTYPPIEKYCKENDLINEIKVKRNDSNPPHINYTFNGTKKENIVYDYIDIDNNTGKVYLTLDGVNAIDKDHLDDPSKDITKLTFQILAKDIEQGDTLTVDVTVGVVRIHDEPPKIIDKQEYQIYQEDAKENERILDIRTARKSFYYVNNDLVKIREVDIGRVVLTDKGIDYIKKLDLKNSKTKRSLDFKLKIKDQENNLVIEKEYQIPIKPGHYLKVIPKKSILEEVGMNLGEDLALKIEKNRLSIEEKTQITNIILEDIVAYEKNSTEDNSKNNTPYYDSYIGKAIENNIIVGKDKNNKNFEKMYDTIKKSLTEIFDAYNNENEKIVKLLPNNIEQVYNQIEETPNNINQMNFELLDEFDDSNIFLSIIYNTYQRALAYSKDYTNESLKLVNKAIHYVATEITDEIFKLEENYSKFKYVEYCHFKGDTQNNIKNIKDCLNVITDQICGGKYNSNCCKREDGKEPILTRVSTNEGNISDLQDEVKKIESWTLEDWGKDTKWNFTTNSTSGTLQHYQTNVLSKTSNQLTVGNSDFNRVRVAVDGETYTFDGSGLDLGSKKLTADVCKCTATQAQYADLAEIYASDEFYSIGTIMSVGGKNEVTKFSKINDNLIGVISEHPGFVLNSGAITEYQYPVLIGLKGRIKIKSKIPFKKADKIYPDFNDAGYANNTFNHHLIGYALEDSIKIKENKYLTLIYYKGI